MIAYYDNEPNKIEALGHGKYYVNFDITQTEDGYECEQYKIACTPTYPIVVETLIRENYTISDELALLRQKETKPSEYEEYNTYCESCKAKARQIFPASEGGE